MNRTWVEGDVAEGNNPVWFLRFVFAHLAFSHRPIRVIIGSRVSAAGWIAGSGDTVSAQSGAVRDCHFTLFGDRYWTECAACHSRARRCALLRSANVIRSATASRAVTARSRSSPVNREAARFNHV